MSFPLVFCFRPCERASGRRTPAERSALYSAIIAPLERHAMSCTVLGGITCPANDANAIQSKMVESAHVLRAGCPMGHEEAGLDQIPGKK